MTPLTTRIPTITDPRTWEQRVRDAFERQPITATMRCKAEEMFRLLEREVATLGGQPTADLQRAQALLQQYIEQIDAVVRRPDPDTDAARLARHRALHNIGLPPHPHQALIATQRDEAILHLHAILNTQRTATQSWQAEQEARQWLASIGSDPT